MVCAAEGRGVADRRRSVGRTGRVVGKGRYLSLR
jgi:hypothetical protein